MTGWDLPRVALVPCGACGAEHHPDCIGPDRACVACWELRPGVSRRYTVQVVLGRAARVVGADRLSYAACPWDPQTCAIATRDRVWTGDGARSLSRRMMREARRVA